MRIGTRWMKCSLAVVLLGVQLLAGAQINTWTDQHGRKHFADEAGTPEHQRTTPVTVPPPNVIERFVPPAQLSPQAAGDEGANSGATPTAPPVPPQAQRSPSRSSREDACKAAKAAYEASLACFQGCGRRGVYGTDNSACGRCQELPIPDC